MNQVESVLNYSYTSPKLVENKESRALSALLFNPYIGRGEWECTFLKCICAKLNRVSTIYADPTQYIIFTKIYPGYGNDSVIATGDFNSTSHVSTHTTFFIIREAWRYFFLWWGWDTGICSSYLLNSSKFS